MVSVKPVGPDFITVAQTDSGELQVRPVSVESVKIYFEMLVQLKMLAKETSIEIQKLKPKVEEEVKVLKADLASNQAAVQTLQSRIDSLVHSQIKRRVSQDPSSEPQAKRGALAPPQLSPAIPTTQFSTKAGVLDRESGELKQSSQLSLPLLRTPAVESSESSFTSESSDESSFTPERSDDSSSTSKSKSCELRSDQLTGDLKKVYDFIKKNQEEGRFTSTSELKQFLKFEGEIFWPIYIKPIRHLLVKWGATSNASYGIKEAMRNKLNC